MPANTTPDLGSRSPAYAFDDSQTVACALDWAADVALFFGRATTAERLSIRAADLREANQ